ncbi:MAG: low temperature requirement protein A [Caulobacterales bacterium]|nr:low temperature requirement protein A [Caulobacterales bacterium]
MSDRLLRARGGGHEAGRVTYVELFFDLVFVFAITQLSHTLLHDSSPKGWLETGILLLGVWWQWIDTAWVTNWLNPERRPVRVALLALMLASLVISTSLPTAFTDRAVVFGLAYGLTHIARSAFMLWAGHSNRPVRGTFIRLLIWHLIIAAAWAFGAFTDEHTRLWVWGGAILFESCGALAGFWLPFIGRAHSADWNVEGAHLAERCALFIIIALGESILSTGASAAGLASTPLNWTAFAVAFLGSVAMWWIYFSNVVELGAQRISHATDPGALARSAYTYLHIPIVAGIIVTAVGDEKVLHHPTGHADASTIAVILIGGGLYLLGAALFKYAISGKVSAPRVAGLLAMGALWPVAGHLSPLALSGATTAVMVIVAAWEGWLIAHGAHGAEAAERAKA